PLRRFAGGSARRTLADPPGRRHARLRRRPHLRGYRSYHRLPGRHGPNPHPSRPRGAAKAARRGEYALFRGCEQLSRANARGIRKMQHTRSAPDSRAMAWTLIITMLGPVLIAPAG